MFTGIVRQMGTVVRLSRRGGGSELEVHAPETVEHLVIGDSVAVNGACVTVTGRRDASFTCDLIPETLARTNLGTVQPGEAVNLELPMRAGDRFDGHFVQGHVDAIGTVRSRRRVGAQEILEVNVPFEMTRYLTPKGSVAVDGVSLTLLDVNKDRFRVALIPHTLAASTLGVKMQGAIVNVEVDVLSKYVERHLAMRAPLRPIVPTGDEPPREPPPARDRAARPAPPPKGAAPVARRASGAAGRPSPKRPSKPARPAKPVRKGSAVRRRAAPRSKRTAGRARSTAKPSRKRRR